MPFYIRRSISAGPFRFNFSKGGIGASVGVKGFRIGTGPRGHYVHAGRGGIYYRATIGRAGEQRHASSASPMNPPLPVVDEHDGVPMIEIDSGDVLAMRDETFANLIDEINAKRQQLPMASVIGWSLVAIGIGIALIAGPGGLIVSFLGLPGWAVGRWLDSYRRTCVLYYELDADMERDFANATHCFDALADCAGKWHVEAGGAVRDLTTWKRNAGASHLVRKKPTTLGYSLPSAITCNITPPSLKVGKQVIHFLPDLALIDDGQAVGAISYGDLTIVSQDSNFIEEGVVPHDAQVIRHTWKHPNKSGGPDRRFRDNRQIPICRYEVMHIRSTSGVNELVEFSRTGFAQPFATALRQLRRSAAMPGTRALR